MGLSIGFCYNGQPPGGRITGAQVAELSFLRELVRHGGFRALDVLVPVDQVSSPLLAEVEDARVRVRGFDALPAAVAEGRYDVVHAPYPFVSQVAWLREMASKRFFPITGFVHSLAHPDVALLIARNLRLASHGHDTAFCPSRAVKRVLRRLFGELRRELGPAFGAAPALEIQPLGVEVDRFTAGDRLAERAAHGLPADARILLYVGRLQPWTKMDLLPLVTAFARLSRRHPALPLRLIIAGQEQLPGYAALLLASAASAGAGDRVQVWEGVPRAQLPRVYALADVFVSPTDSVQETFGLTPLEAMSAGLPVVLAGWNGYRELISDGVEGYLVPVRRAAPDPVVLDTGFFLGYDRLLAHLGQTAAVDLDVLEDRLERLLLDPGLRQRMGAAGRARAETFAWASVVERCERYWARRAQALRAVPLARSAPGLYRLAYERMFQHYPSASLDPHAPLFPREDGPSEATLRLLVRQAGLPWTVVSGVLGHLQARPGTSLRELPRGMGARADVRRALHLLLKQGCLALVPQPAP